jgi:hypothetical protein
MTEKSDDSFNDDLFVTEFPKKGLGIVDYLQGRVHFALLDQMKFMSTSGMTLEKIKKTIIANVNEVVENFDPQKESKSH